MNWMPHLLRSSASLTTLLAAAGCSVATGDEVETTSTQALTLTSRVVSPRHVMFFTGQLVTPNGLCLDVKDAGTTPGTPLDVYNCNQTPAQNFGFQLDGSVTGPGGQCLDVDSTGTLVMDPCNGATSQKWNLEGQRLVRQLDSTGPLCASTQPNPGLNAPVLLKSCAQAYTGGNDQWTLAGVPGPLVGIGENCVDIVNGSTSPGAGVQMFTCSGAPGQTFHFTTSGQIVSAAGLCLEPTNVNGGMGGIDMNACNDNVTQRWEVDGRAIRAWAFDGCLDVQYGDPQVHAPLDLAPCNGTQAQQFFAPAGYTQGMATLLVVSDESMAPATTQLVSFKNQNKMPAALMTVNDFRSLVCGSGSNPTCDGKDLAEIVKRGIDFFFRNRGTKYVFLAGDATHVPVRFETRYDQHYNDSLSGYYSPTDLYYANLYHHADPVGDIPTTFSPWDNGDGIYNLSAYWTPASVWNPDNVDGYPDVAIGRLDVSQEGDLANYVAKVINYETNDMAYALSGTFVEDAIYDNDDKVAPGGVYAWSTGMANDLFPGSVNNTFLSVNYYNVVNADYSGNVAAWPLPRPWQAASPQDVVNKAATSGIVTYLGHSAVDGWDSPGSLGYEQLFSQMTQTDNFPMILGAACFSGKFADIGTFGPSGVVVLLEQPTLAQFSAPPPAPTIYSAFSNYVLAHATSGGGIAYAALQEEHAPGPDLDLFVLVAQRYAAGEKTIGDMWRQAQQQYWHTNVGSSGADQKTDSAEWEIREPRILFGAMQFAGDPSLRMQRSNGPVR